MKSPEQFHSATREAITSPGFFLVFCFVSMVHIEEPSFRRNYHIKTLFQNTEPTQFSCAQK